MINIGLCGNWANNTYKSSGCSAQFGTCSNQVASQMSSFDNAFWSINSVTIFASNNFNLNPVLEAEIASSSNAVYSLRFQTQTFSIVLIVILFIAFL